MRSLRKPSKKTAKAAIKPCRFAAYLRDLQQRPEPSSEAVEYKKRATERAGSTRPPAASRHPDYRDYGDCVNRRPGAGLVCVDH